MHTIDTSRLACAIALLVGHAVLLAQLARPSLAPNDHQAAHSDPDIRPMIARFLVNSDQVSGSHWELAVAPRLVTWDMPATTAAPPDIEALLADSVAPSREIVSQEDLVEVEKLQGIYKGQLSGRIARMLQMHGASDLHLETDRVLNVIQTEQGAIIDILADECNEDAVTVQVVARAVRAASPLPAPPQGLAPGTYLILRMRELLVARPRR